VHAQKSSETIGSELAHDYVEGLPPDLLIGQLVDGDHDS
jgi:hypothetical protein